MKTALKISILFLIFQSFQVKAQRLSIPSENNKKLLFKAEMSRLWIDNAIWSRLSVLCLVDRLPGTEETLYRLMINQEDMGRMFTRFYGKEKGDEFCNLISSNTSLVIGIIRNKSKNNTGDLEVMKKRMESNTKKIIEFLVSVNPNFHKEELEYLISLQSKLFEVEIQNRINKNYIYDVENFDRIISETYILADILSEGIIKQLPERFD